MLPDPQPGEIILVVEDDPLLRGAMKMVLEWEGYRARCAANGQEALNLLLDGKKPSLILLDMRMPVLGGQQFRERQKACPEISDIPVVVISGVEPFSLDAAGYIQKPFEPQEFIEAVRRCARPRRPNVPGRSLNSPATSEKR
jgi:CheY-like chemotaxis protein